MFRAGRFMRKIRNPLSNSSAKLSEEFSSSGSDRAHRARLREPEEQTGEEEEGIPPPEHI